MPEPTPTQRLAEELLDQPLTEFVRSRRPGTSWRLIARELHAATDGKVDVTSETVRLWYGASAQAAS